MKVQITFKSGAQIVADIDEISTARHRASGELTSVKWTTPDDWTAKLHTVDIAEIAAIVAIREPGQ